MGQLLLTLACSAGGVAVPNLDYAASHYSPDFVRCLALLLGAGEGGAFSWRHMAALTGERMMMEVDTLAMFNDNLVGWLRGGDDRVGAWHLHKKHSASSIQSTPIEALERGTGTRLPLNLANPQR